MIRCGRGTTAALAALVAFAASASVAGAQGRAEVTLSDTAATPENVTSSRDGTLYFGSMATGTIYRAAPGAARAEPWILASAAGLTTVLGVLADDRTNTLWVCQNAAGGRGGVPATGQTALRSFDLRTGAPKGTYPFPANAGFCNDIAVAADGAVYASESYRGRVHRLRPGAAALEVWASDTAMNVIDGLAFLADGALYVNTFDTGRLFRIPVNVDGTAGALVPIGTSLPLTRPDGLRAVGPRTLLQAEQGGRVAELTIDGSRATVRVLRDGLSRAAGVTLVGDTAFVLVFDARRALAVPYRATPAGASRGAPPLPVRKAAVSPAEQALLDLSRTKWRWMAEKKADTLATLFHEDAVFVHMGGAWGTAQEVQIIRSGGIHYKHAEIFEASARIIDDTGIVLSRIRLDAVVGGNEVSNPFLVTEVYVRQGTTWKLGSLSFTRLAQ